MTLTADAKTTCIFDSHGQPFLTGQRFLSGNNLHWFIGKPHNRTGALGYLVNLNIKHVNTVQLATDRQEDFNNFDLWHQRLGHPLPQTMRHASRATNGFDGMVIPNKPPICSDCQIGKMPTWSFPPSDKRTESPLAMVHCNLVEFPVESYYRHKYCLTIIDDYSGYGTICLLRAKSDTARAFSVWVTWAEKQWSASLLQVRSNRGGEFMATIFHSFLTDKGVQHQLSVADHPQQNGRAKRFN